MKSKFASAWMIAASLTAFGLTSLPAATLIYGFDSATVNGNTVLINSAANVGSASYSFDTTDKTQGTASLNMTGTYTSPSQSGYFGPYILIGKLLPIGTSQDLSANNTTIAFDYQIANANPFPTGPGYGSEIKMQLYKGGNGDGTGGTIVATFYQKLTQTNTSGFESLSSVVVNASGAFGTGWTAGSGQTVSDLANVTYMRAILAWAQPGSPNNIYFSTSSLDYHIDNLQISGAGVIPEPSTAMLLLGGLVVLGGIRHVRRTRFA